MPIVDMSNNYFTAIEKAEQINQRLLELKQIEKQAVKEQRDRYMNTMKSSKGVV
jgi:hypothetical protein